MKKPTLTPTAILQAAAALNVSRAAVLTVLTVEAPRGGFQDDGQVSILFEPHKFSEYTNGRFDKSHPDLSYPKWGTRPYGTYSSQHAKLQRAVALDREAALMATSWGKPQILGRNWAQAGAKSLQDFINRMSRSEDEQLALFVAYIKNETRKVDGVSLLRALQTRNWATFARLYNGTAYAVNKYDVKLAAAYAAHGGV